VFKRASLVVLTLLALSIPLAAQSQEAAATGTRTMSLKWAPLYMRNTAAASTAREPNWAKGYPGSSPSGFADSIVFRRGVTTATVYDTSAAYRIEGFGFPPNIGTSAQNAVIDSASTPWIVIKVKQDSTSFSFTGATGMDSVRVGAEVSQDGINWQSCPGTPTHRFDVVYFTSGADGLQNPSLIGVERSPGEDMAIIPFRCHPPLASSNATIVNRGLCMESGWVRFIIGLDSSGQYAPEIASWND